MPFWMMEKAFRELGELDYSGIINLNNNNEPLLDERMPEIVSSASGMVPKALLTLWTNGICLNWDRHRVLFENGLHVLHINNYANNGRVHQSVQDFITEFQNSELSKRGNCAARVCLRRLDEVGDNRGGTSPNKRATSEFKALNMPCHVPFVQAHLNYKGDLFLCCIDILYNTPLGNIGEQRLLDIWTGDKYQEVRRAIGSGERHRVKPCSTCDSSVTLPEARVRRTGRGHWVYVLPGVIREYGNVELLQRYVSDTEPLSSFARSSKRRPDAANVADED